MAQARVTDSVKNDLERLIIKKNTKEDRKNVTVSEVISDLITFHKNNK